MVIGMAKQECRNCKYYYTCGFSICIKVENKCLYFTDVSNDVRAVRCKDCKWFNPDENIMPESGTCEYHEMVKMFWDYCSRGRRMT